MKSGRKGRRAAGQRWRMAINNYLKILLIDNFVFVKRVFDINAGIWFRIKKAGANRTYRGIYCQAMAGINMCFRMMPFDMIMGMKRRNHQACTEKYKH